MGAGVMMDGPLDALRAVCLAVAVSARPGSGAASHARLLNLPCLYDDAADAEGPLAGIRCGLAWARDGAFDWLGIAPCDAPTLAAAQYQALIEAVRDGAPAAVGQGETGLEPLVSLWPVADGSDAVDAALSEGRHPAIRQVLAAINAVPIRLNGYDGANVNTPADLKDRPLLL